MRNSILKQVAVILLTSVSLPALAQDQSEALRAAYDQYAAARIAMSQAEIGSADAAAQTDAAINAQANLAAICADLGAPEMAACFDQFLPPEVRVPNDAEPITPAPAPMAEEPAPVVEPIAPETEQTPEPEPQAEPIPEAEQVPQAEPAPEAEPVSEPEPVPAEEPAAAEETAKKAPEETTVPLTAIEPAPAVDEQPTEDMAGEDVKPEEVAPLLDSAKEEPAAQMPAEDQPVAGDTPEQKKKRKDKQKVEAGVQEPVAEVPVAQEPAAPAPKSDAEAQASVEPQKIEAVEAEQGTPLEDQLTARRQRATNAPEAAKPIQQDEGGFRIIFQFGNQLIVENQDSTRLTGRSSERTVEELRRGRTRETITRRDGSRIVTIYNRNGDILRRSKFTPEGQEIVLVSVNQDREDDLLEWRDPGRDLPPLRLSIPARDYVLDAEDADEGDLIEFLDQPPVESVRRLYSIDEVKRSARIRDSVRRLEIGGLTFDTGKATISPDQVNALTNTAKAMLRLLDDNPAETFLIEGHTDAVGSDISNLELSDRRAETIAIVLSDVYGIPPENLTTQGYGERYLKIRTEGDERLNRRVTVRRITPLVAPIAQR